jgi:hypothetical protein
MPTGMRHSVVALRGARFGVAEQVLQQSSGVPASRGLEPMDQRGGGVLCPVFVAAHVVVQAPLQRQMVQFAGAPASAESEFEPIHSPPADPDSSRAREAGAKS